jgi:hypothetical protein
MSLPLMAEYGGVACSDREKVEPVRGKMVLGPAENRVILALSEAQVGITVCKEELVSNCICQGVPLIAGLIIDRE